ncbi:nuclear transport factor 2 family protein [Pseudophaeobacter sp.]|uniref:nuclear transport factor 2 family protein n=1 Tax=Pseudophaeobacter sp. TaxID=1971739 RepID=UPI0040596BD8
MTSNRELLQIFLKGLETGEAMAAAVVDETKYIQHNPQTHEGSEGIATLFARLAKTNPKVTFQRVFEDGDFAFAHIEYNFSSLRVAFEVFRFETDKAVEHWDNIQPQQPVNPSGRSMLDGETEIRDHARTEENRAQARRFVQQVLIDGAQDKILDFVQADLIQHHPLFADGTAALLAALSGENTQALNLRYQKLHRVLAEGNFVLCVSEGWRGTLHSSFYDLFRLEAGRIVEHWNTTETVPARHEWKNDNGKF